MGLVECEASDGPMNANLLYYTFKYRSSSTATFQYAYRALNGNIWKRGRNSSGDWGSWQRVYDEGILTDSTILAPLASAIGNRFYAMAKIITLAAGATHTESQVGAMADGLWQIIESSNYGSAILFVNKHGSIVPIFQDATGGMSNIVVAKTSAWEFTITNNNSSSLSIVLRKM